MSCVNQITSEFAAQYEEEKQEFAAKYEEEKQGLIAKFKAKTEHLERKLKTRTTDLERTQETQVSKLEAQLSDARHNREVKNKENLFCSKWLERGREREMCIQRRFSFAVPGIQVSLF